MTDHGDREVITSRLRQDVLRHVVTLKMLHFFGDSMELRFAQDDAGWALLSLLPVRVSEFDRQVYPNADTVVLVDGVSDALKSALLAGLPAGRLVIKAHDDFTRKFALEALGAQRALSFRSFTLPPTARLEPAPTGIMESEALDPEIARILARNGYTGPELARFFAAGARWYAIEEAGRYVSAGFVFPIFERVWEVGGLYTEPDHRRRGHARRIVAAALGHLAARNLITRYQVRSDNLESVRLAETAGLREFLRIDHFVAVRA
jgi:ribosomal protein S18 acetylase RimI-like enzyme